MYVETHHVTQATGHEHGMRTRLDCLHRIALDET